MPHESIAFGGLAALSADELAPLGRAIAASDCVLDDDTISARNGYTAASANALDSTGTPQGIWRYRPGPGASDGHCVAVVGGKARSIEDPASDTAKVATTPVLLTGGDKSATWSTAQISAAQLGTHLYIGSDVSGDTWLRVSNASPITAAAMTALPRPALPTQGSPTTLAFEYLYKASAPVWTPSAYPNPGDTEFEYVTGRASERSTRVYHTFAPDTYVTDGCGVLWTRSAPADWTGYGILMVAVVPPPSNKGGGTVQIELGDAAANFEIVGEVRDDTYNDYTPGVIYLRLDNISATILGDVKYIRFIMRGTGLFMTTGFMLAKRSPGVGSFRYMTTFYDATTGQESTPSEELVVDVASPSGSAFPKFGLWAQWKDDMEDYIANVSANPNSISDIFNGNRAMGLSTPALNEFGEAPVITQAIPSALQAAGTCRLWRFTSTGWRIVKSTTWTTTTTTVTFTDDLSDSVLGNASWRAYGSPPRCTAMAARAGRVVAAYENRLWISSFVGAGATSDPYPQFPAIAEEEGDGWAFDIAPSPAEQVLALVDGDALYILTSEACYLMRDLSPNAVPSLVLRRGCLGRRACVYAEDRLYWAGWDGIYVASGRAQVEELTHEVRRYYRDTFAASSATVMAYEGRHLYAFTATRFMRLDLASGRWTTGTIADTPLHAACWHDPGGVSDRMWLLASDRNVYRWLDSATSDDGATIPDWAYSTGYWFAGLPARVRAILADATGGDVSLTLYKAGGSTPSRTATITPASDGVPVEVIGPADLRAYKWRLRVSGDPGAILRHLAWELEPIAARGG